MKRKNKEIKRVYQQIDRALFAQLTAPETTAKTKQAIEWWRYQILSLVFIYEQNESK